jgi:lysophospholipase L1-like esterase
VIISQHQPVATHPLLFSCNISPAANAGPAQLMCDADNSYTHANGGQISGTQADAFVNGFGGTSVLINLYGTETQDTNFAIRRWYSGGNAVVTTFYNNSPVVTAVAASGTTAAGVLGLGGYTYWGIADTNASDTTVPPSIGVVFEGDSLTWGGGGLVTLPGGATAGNSYPAMLQTQYGGPSQVEAANIGYPGYFTSQMVPGRTTNLLQNPAFTTRWAVYWGGTNDAYALDSASSILANIATWAAAMTTAGVSFIVCELIYAGPTGTSNYLAVNAIIDTVNAGLLAAYNTPAANTCQLNNAPQLNEAENFTYRAADGIHLTVAGYAVVAEYVQAVLPSFP